MSSAESRAIEFAPLRGFDAEETEDDFHGGEIGDLEGETSTRHEPSLIRAL
jgi:hypothetical protein